MSQENTDTARGVQTTLPPLSERASQRRSIDERLGVRFPSVYRALSNALTRLPPQSRLRQRMLARTMTRAYAAANRRDFELVFVGMDLDAYEYRPSRDLLPPDLETVFHGRDGYLKLWRYWIEAFGDIRWDPEEVVDFGHHVLVRTQQKGHGSGSGVAVVKPVFQLFTLRRGLVVRQEDFVDRESALEAAGLSE